MGEDEHEPEEGEEEKEWRKKAEAGEGVNAESMEAVKTILETTEIRKLVGWAMLRQRNRDEVYEAQLLEAGVEYEAELLECKKEWADYSDGGEQEECTRGTGCKVEVKEELNEELEEELTEENELAVKAEVKDERTEDEEFNTEHLERVRQSEEREAALLAERDTPAAAAVPQPSLIRELLEKGCVEWDEEWVGGLGGVGCAGMGWAGLG